MQKMSATPRRIVSCLVLVHFAAIGLTYATNWKRSAIQDAVLVGLQPYLIGLNWYQEMLPIEWISEDASSVKVSIQTSQDTNQWRTVLDSTKTEWNGARTERFLRPLTEFALSENSQGLNDVFKSIVLHLEKGTTNDTTVIKIRLERVSESKPETKSESVLYEASLARFPTGEFGFVPMVESHRSVRSLKQHQGLQ